MKKALLSLFFLVFVSASFGQVVPTQFGAVQGTTNGTVKQFLGIPFAKPPVDTLRWKAPVNPIAWADTLLATAFSPLCSQKLFQQGDTTGTLVGSEDCLYLNVWTPNLAGSKAVMVFIHGGGNQQGGASEVAGGTQFYFGKNLAERGDVVVVTIQYRLGALGYMVHPGLEGESTSGTAGNYGVLDQLLALTWVKNNIANFGGDPDRVMIFGESAGGTNVGNLLTTPMAAGLFQRACIESAAPVINSYADSKNKGIQFVNTYPLATGTDVQKIAYMRSLPADSISNKNVSPLQGGVVQKNWPPVIDGFVFFDTPINVFQSGTFNKVPLMIGSNSEEMSLSAPQTVTPAMVNLLVSTTLPLQYQSAVLALYPPGNTNTQARQSYVGILTDGQFTTPVRRTAECVSKNQLEPVWRYFFTHKHTVQALANFGSYHGMELFYVFNTWENATLGQGQLFKPADDSVQKAMLAYWVNFANTGNPNGNALPAWPEFDAATDCYLEIKATPNGNQCGLRTEKSDLWDDITGFFGCTASAVAEDIADKLILYPNPATNNVTITLPTNEPFNVRVFDRSGREVHTTIKANTGYSIPTAGLVNGLYFVQVVTAKGVSTQKLVVSR